jgi:hypothetical protein
MDFTNCPSASAGATRINITWMRNLRDFLLALYVAYGSVLVAFYRPFGPRDLSFRVQDMMASLPGVGVGLAAGCLAIALFVLCLTVPLYVLIRLLHWVNYGLLLAWGLLWIGVTPACWLLVYGRSNQWYGNPAETAIAVLLPVLYLQRKWRLPGFVSLLIAGIHFGFWYSRFAECDGGFLQLALPPLGFCGCVMWGLHAASSCRE